MAIENTMIRNLSGAVFMAFTPRQDLLSTPFEAILAFDPDGRVVGSNRRARALLSIDPAERDLQFEELFSSMSFAEAMRETASPDWSRILRSSAGLQMAARFDGCQSRPNVTTHRSPGADKQRVGGVEQSKQRSAMSFFRVVSTDARTAQVVERARRRSVPGHTDASFGRDGHRQGVSCLRAALPELALREALRCGQLRCPTRKNSRRNSSVTPTAPSQERVEAA